MSRPRTLHAGAWWLWALGLAAAATRTLNPLVLVEIIAVVACVVAARRSDAPWSASFKAFVVLGVFVLGVRVVFEVLFGPELPGTVAFTVPQFILPGWMAGARLGGPVTVTAVLTALYSGLQLMAILVCVGAASALAAPTRLLKSVPGALYEVGVALVVALTVVPQTVTHVGQVREARRLRGRTDRGLRAWTATARPVLDGALERSLLLAAALDSRGYGRSSHLPPRERWVTGGLVLGGLFGVLVGTYGLLDAAQSGLLGLALIAVGATLAVAGMARAGRRSVRTVYRPDLWSWPEWTTSASGLLPAVVVGVLAAQGAADLSPAAAAWPQLPVVAFVVVFLALLPAWVAPAPPRQDPVPAAGPRTADRVAVDERREAVV
ncbi:MAG: energy-coupling factor transporter transmembrane protein EcfT [Actinomycetes bacterium]